MKYALAILGLAAVLLPAPAGAFTFTITPPDPGHPSYDYYFAWDNTAELVAACNQTEVGYPGDYSWQFTDDQSVTIPGDLSYIPSSTLSATETSPFYPSQPVHLLCFDTGQGGGVGGLTIWSGYTPPGIAFPTFITNPTATDLFPPLQSGWDSIVKTLGDGGYAEMLAGVIIAGLLVTAVMGALTVAVISAIERRWDDIAAGRRRRRTMRRTRKTLGRIKGTWPGAD